jgi:modulator of FtsH protease
MGYHLPVLSVALSGVVCLLMSGVILYQTGEIVNGGETNYIRATAVLFASIWSLFVHLLNILGFANDE